MTHSWGMSPGGAHMRVRGVSDSWPSDSTTIKANDARFGTASFQN